MNREPQSKNNLFYCCSLIEFISRKTNNSKKDIATSLGKEAIEKIYNLADVYHSENIEKVAQEFILKCGINNGNYDYLTNCTERIPTYFEIGRVIADLVLKLSSSKEEYVKTLVTVLSSWIMEKLDDYNSSLYYESPEYILACYKEGHIL